MKTLPTLQRSFVGLAFALLFSWQTLPASTPAIAQIAKIVESGTDINLATSSAADGDTVISGAPWAYAFPNNLRQGAAYIYIRNGPFWAGQARLSIPHESGTDYFGGSVAISGDSVIVGSMFDDSCGGQNFGAAYVFVRTGTTWSLQAQLCAPVGGINQEFGGSVAISGNTAVVGERGAYTYHGAAYVFVRNGSTWTMQKELVPSFTGTNSIFGRSVAIDGETIAVGAHDVSVGAAYIFVRNGTDWTEQARITASDGDVGDAFGQPVQIDGNTLAVGSMGDDVGGNQNQGSAYVFARHQATWDFQAKLVAPDGGVQDRFGISLGLDGNYLAIGAPSHRVGANARQGAGYLFTRSGTTWTLRDTIFDLEGAAGDEMGTSAALSGKNIVFGAPYDTTYNAGQGAVDIFANSYVVNATVTGRVIDAGGRGVSKAVLTITDGNGNTQVHLTNPFGYYRFYGLQTNNTYELSVRSKRFTFSPRTLNLMGDLSDVDFTPAP